MAQGCLGDMELISNATQGCLGYAAAATTTVAATGPAEICIEAGQTIVAAAEAAVAAAV